MLRIAHLIVHLTIAQLCIVFTTAAEDAYVIDKESSIFAVVTHRGGILSGLAHDHFVYAGDYAARLVVTGDDPETLTFSFDLVTVDLVIDDPEVKSRWYPELKAAGIVDDPFKNVSESDRRKIRDAMLSDEQLDAEAFPHISAKLVGLKPLSEPASGDEPGFSAMLEVTIHGKTSTETFPARIRIEGDNVEATAYAALKFTDFGIKPYRAALGSVRNKDEFHVYVSITAQKRPADVEDRDR